MKEICLFEIIETFLRENNFDGLYNEDYECSCPIDDLIPCDEPKVNFCKPGYKQKDNICIGPEKPQNYPQNILNERKKNG